MKLKRLQAGMPLSYLGFSVFLKSGISLSLRVARTDAVFEKAMKQSRHLALCA